MRASASSTWAAARSPSTTADETVWITYNGEVFNYIELRAELLGARPRVLHAERHRSHRPSVRGTRRRLRRSSSTASSPSRSGIARRRRLLLVRDRAGILPLYYARVPGGVVFASEVKALLASGRVQAALDPDGLDELMTFWAPLAPRTVFRGRRAAAPGRDAGAGRRQPCAATLLALGFPANAPALRRDAPEKLSDELHDLLADATRNPAARRRARGRLSIRRPRFLVAGGAAQGARAATRCRRSRSASTTPGSTSPRISATVVRTPATPTTTTCSARCADIAGAFPRTDAPRGKPDAAHRARAHAVAVGAGAPLGREGGADGRGRRRGARRLRHLQGSEGAPVLGRSSPPRPGARRCSSACIPTSTSPPRRARPI